MNPALARIIAEALLLLYAIAVTVALLLGWRDHAVDVAVGTTEQQQCVSYNTGADLALTELQLALSQCQGQWREATGRADAAAGLAATASERARAQFASWRATYEASPPSCTAAREALDTACADLKDY